MWFLPNTRDNLSQVGVCGTNCPQNFTTEPRKSFINQDRLFPFWTRRCTYDTRQRVHGAHGGALWGRYEEISDLICDGHGYAGLRPDQFEVVAGIAGVYGEAADPSDRAVRAGNAGELHRFAWTRRLPGE